MSNNSLCRAKQQRNDEFYTQYKDIKKELDYYKEFLRGKVILCNCDNPEYSNFWKYFHTNFTSLGLRKLIASYYDVKNPVYKSEYCGGDDSNIHSYIKTHLEGNGDFRSKECLVLLKESDIIVTNPPFSLFREYLQTLIVGRITCSAGSGETSSSYSPGVAET